MELVLSSQNLEPFPKQEIVRPEGLLNSNYKRIVSSNYKTTNTNTLFAIKQRVKSRQFQFTSSIDTILKLTVFTVAIVLMFS